MARPYDPRFSYDPALDVRTWDDLAALVVKSEPRGLFWPLVGPRRSGKTWALHGVAAAIGKEESRVVRLDRHSSLDEVDLTDPRVLLVDEPGKFIFAPGAVGRGTPRVADPGGLREFFAWCRDAREAERRLLIAMTPAEWAALSAVGRANTWSSEHDLQDHLRPLRPDQAARIAADGDAPAAALLAALAARAEDWLRNPFVVRHLLDVADRSGLLAGGPVDLGDLLPRAIASLVGIGDADYVTMVLYEGLSAAQQAALRAIARDDLEAADPAVLGLLQASGLVDRPTGGARPRLRDPVLAAHLPPPLRIHHISDVHVGPKGAARVNQAGVGPAADNLAKGAGQSSLRQSYLEHVEQRRADGRGPHLVVVSGDLTETGRDAENEAARAFLGALAGLLADHPDLRAGEPRVLLVGGNHDVDWAETRGAAGARKRHLRFAAAFADYPRPRLEEPPEARALAVVAYPDAGLEVALLGSAEFGGEIDELLVGMVDELQAQARARGEAGDDDDARRLRSRLGRLDPGLVHHLDLHRLRAHRSQARVRIAVLHHPVSPLPATTDVAPYAGLLNAGAVKDALIDRRFALVLHGHMHSQWLGEERWPSHASGDHTLRIAAAPSLASREVSEAHGYNEILILREGEAYELEVRAHARAGDTWQRRSPGLGPFAVD